MKIKNIAHLEALLRKAGEVDPDGRRCNDPMVTTDGEGGPVGAHQGRREHWIDAFGAYHNYGSGPGWSDQSDEVRDCYNLKFHLSKLWRKRYDFQRNMED